MSRFLAASTASFVVLSSLALAQTSSDGASRAAVSTGGGIAAVTVEKPTSPQVRRAEAVRRAPEPAREPALSGAGIAFRAGDSFQLRLTGMPAEDAQMYSLDFTIGGDGYVNIPLAGQVRAAGLTQSQLEKAIERKLVEEKVFRWPTATINVPPQIRFVTVGGNVRAPNRLAWSSDLTLLAALSAAGGASDFGGDRVNLIRNGAVTQYRVSRLKRNPADDPKLQPGDQVDLQ